MFILVGNKMDYINNIEIFILIFFLEEVSFILYYIERILEGISD